MKEIPTTTSIFEPFKSAKHLIKSTLYKYPQLRVYLYLSKHLLKSTLYVAHEPARIEKRGNLFICLSHGRMNYKDTEPYMSAFLKIDLLIDFAAFV